MKNTLKAAETDHDILPIFSERYSPYVFEPKPVEREKLLKMLEAARWSASSFNEQPWRFVLAERTDTQAFEKALGCLVESNQEWAKHAGALLLCCTKKNFSYNDKPNRVNEHDLGLAGANLTLQGMHEGVYVHMMAGIDADKIRETYGVPEEFVPLTAIAIGYPGEVDADYLEDSIAERDAAKRSRMPLPEFVFGNTWEQPAGITQ